MGRGKNRKGRNENGKEARRGTRRVARGEVHERGRENDVNLHNGIVVVVVVNSLLLLMAGCYYCFFIFYCCCPCFYCSY